MALLSDGSVLCGFNWWFCFDSCRGCGGRVLHSGAGVLLPRLRPRGEGQVSQSVSGALYCTNMPDVTKVVKFLMHRIAVQPSFMLFFKE